LNGCGTTTCPSGYVSTCVPVTVPEYAYAAADQGTADAAAQAALAAAAQAAGSSATCIPKCTFTYDPSITLYNTPMITAQSGTLNFDFPFQVPTNGYNSGTLGTLGSSCAPSVQRPVVITEKNNANRSWQLTFNPSGTVTILLWTGTAPLTTAHIELVGSVAQ
jgi:hypothetical protein